MRSEVVLITGADGEVGHGLISHLCETSDRKILALDIKPLDASLEAHCHEVIQGDILDKDLMANIFKTNAISTIYHLASILSTSAERNPELAHRVNVEGTIHLLSLAIEHAHLHNRPIKFLYPSSIAVYGLPNQEVKTASGKVIEDQFCSPITMYGCNKLYCEHLGRYYATHYKQIHADHKSTGLDFRCLRYPGLISASTVPTGGTSDYGPEMLHHAAQDLTYNCFVRPSTELPFMVMSDAIRAMLELEAAEQKHLSRHVYNVTSFSLTAKDFLDRVKKAYPYAIVEFKPDLSRQGIVDSWPADLDDTAAQSDWGWTPDYNIQRAFDEYLIPTISKRYSREL